MSAHSPVARAALRVKHEVHGVVVSAGRMQKTAKVRIGSQQWNSIVNKTFSSPKEVLVHDANSSVRTGDVISIAPGWRTSKGKRHYVKQIIAPFREPIESRPPVLPLSELIDRYEAKRAAKQERLQLRMDADLVLRWRKMSKEEKAEIMDARKEWRLRREAIASFTKEFEASLSEMEAFLSKLKASLSKVEGGGLPFAAN